MGVSRIKTIILGLAVFCFWVNSQANDKRPDNSPGPIRQEEKTVINPYEVPTFSGSKVDWHDIKPAINALNKLDTEYIFKTITNCYPIKPFKVEFKFRAGLNYRERSGSQIQTSDSSKYYAGIVFNMPLYSASEIDKSRMREAKRRSETSMMIGTLLSSIAGKRRAERLMGLYMSLEKRSQQRVRIGVIGVDEQVLYLEKVAITQSELDAANAMLEGSRLALSGQCRIGKRDLVNDILLDEIRQATLSIQPSPARLKLTKPEGEL